jgi:predicted MFS family arabinose efflux permease
MRPNPTRLLALVCALAFLDLALWIAAVPLLPRWERELGLSKVEAGIVLGAYSVSVLLSSLPIGRIADRVGPKRMTVAATVLFAFAAPALAVADELWELVAIRFVQGLFSAISWTAGLAWILAAAPPGLRGRSMAFVNASATAATLAGPAIGGPLVAAAGLDATMVGFACLVAVCAAWASLEPDARAEDGPRPSPLEELALGLRSPRMRSSFVAILFVAGAIGTVQLLAPLHLGDAGLSDANIGWVFTAAALGGLTVSVVLSRIADRIDQLRAMVVAATTIGVGTLVLAAGPPLPGYVADAIALSVAASPLFILSYTLCAIGAGEAGTGAGLAMGALNTVWAAGSLAAPATAGLLAQAGGDALPFALVAAAALPTAAALVSARRSLRTAAAA